MSLKLTFLACLYLEEKIYSDHGSICDAGGRGNVSFVIVVVRMQKLNSYNNR